MKEGALKTETIIGVVSGGILLFGIAELAVVYFALPEQYTHYMLSLPVIFLCFAVAMLSTFLRKQGEGRHSGRTISRMLLFNAVQFLAAIAIMVFYAISINVQRKAYLLMFGIYYIWFVLLKLYVLYNIEHKQKEKTANEKA